MNDLLDVALKIQSLLTRLQLPFCFIGGLAVQRWGEPRVTRDVDLTVLTGFENEKDFINQMLRHFEPRIQDALEFALTNRVLLLKNQSGVGIDLALGGLPFEQKAIENSSMYEYAKDCVLRTISANDLIIMKAFASRPRDWNDIDGIIIRSKSCLNLDYIISELAPLAELKEQPEIVEKLRKLFD